MNNDVAADTHHVDEATPQDELFDVVPPNTSFGLQDSAWKEEQWQALISSFVELGLASWRELAALILGHFNPSQTGTSLASSDGFKRNYGKGNTMRIVMDWAYRQTGKCEDCGSRLELQADHIRGREEFDDPQDADFIENMTLRCRRCNVVRRPSHRLGGKTFLTAEAALMWILLVIKPRTFIDFVRLCRLYGMTMSDIRMQESWAMAHWLSRSDPPLYGIEDDENTSYDIYQWPDGAITRTDAGAENLENATRLYQNVPGTFCFVFVAVGEDGRKKLFNYPVSWIAFSTYDLGDLPKHSLSIRYTPPNRKTDSPPLITPLAPQKMEVVSHVIVGRDEKIMFEIDYGREGKLKVVAPEANHNGKLLSKKLQESNLRLIVETEEAP